MKVHICNLLWNFNLEIIVAVRIATYHHVLETHVIASQGTRLVRKYMLDLAKFFI